MNKALFIISLQHELSMAIGNELNLNAMIKVFLKVCFNRLNLTSAHVYIHQNNQHKAIISTPENQSEIKHFFSIPKNKQGQPYQTNRELNDFLTKVIAYDGPLITKNNQSNFLFGFIIPYHGVIILEAHTPLEEAIQKALQPIFNKLAVSCYASIVHDSLIDEIAARKLAEEIVSFQAKHDGLTQLLNRQNFTTLLEQAFKRSIQEKTVGCVIFIDLNKFKPINDTMGHGVGDNILITFAKRLQYIANEHIDVARFGGDEFILLVSNLSDNEDESQNQIQAIIKQVNLTLAAPFVIDSGTYKLSCSIGYAFFPSKTASYHEVIKNADIAMYAAKNSHISMGLMYQEKMSEKISCRLAYVEEIKQGLTNNEFQLYYQPQCNQQGFVIGAEALLRWQHPTRGMESPAVYIPIAEESDLILAIGQWVIEQSCRDIKILEQQGFPKCFTKISINVSAKQLIQYNFKDIVLSNVEKNAITPQRLALELTENLLVESFDDTIGLITELKDYGIECCIDDFGTGYSSLTYLQKIPASVLKIDRSFVTNIDQEQGNRAIASMIINLGNTLNMQVLAEGVETKAELDCLKSLGCFQYQGFYFSRPIPFEAFAQLLRVEQNVL